jgi:hypothetical protein
MPAEGKNLLGELARLVLQTQMEEFTTCARQCGECPKLRRLRDGRTCKVQTLFGTVAFSAPRISVTVRKAISVMAHGCNTLAARPALSVSAKV